MKLASLILALSLISSSSFAGGDEVKKILDDMDRLYRSKTAHCKMRMKITNPNWERTLVMKVWSEGMKKTFITILRPKKEKGIATLRIDREMWNFFPKINKVIKIPPSMMMGSYMGSDFTNDDLVKESTFLDDYTAKLITPADAKPEYVYLELKPRKKTASVWGKIVITGRRKDHLPVEQAYFNEKGEKMRTILFSDIRPLGGKTVPAKMTLMSLNKKDHKTIISYEDCSYNTKLDSDTFTLRNLQKRR